MLNLIAWEPADAAYLRNIFSQPSGRKFLQMVKSAIPKVTATSIEAIAMEAKVKQGAEDLYEYMESLAVLEPELKEGRDFVNLSKEGD